MSRGPLSTSDNDNKGPAILIVNVVSTALAFLAVGLRSYIRLKITRSFVLDDGLIIAAAIVAILGTVFSVDVVKSGAGQHAQFLSPTRIMGIAKWTMIYELQNIISQTFTKLSIMLFILRLKNSKTIKWILWVAMGINVVVNVTAAALILLQCIPLAKAWDPEIPGKCLSRLSLPIATYVQGVISTLTDVLCTALPYAILWKVQIKTRLKVVICGLMSFGLAATAANLARDVLVSFIKYDDFSYDIWSFFIATILEQNIAIVAACVPTFQPLFQPFVNSLHRNSLHRIIDNRSARNSAFPDHNSIAHFRHRSYNNLDEPVSGSGDGASDVRLDQYPDIKE